MCYYFTDLTNFPSTLTPDKKPKKKKWNWTVKPFIYTALFIEPFFYEFATGLFSFSYREARRSTEK